MKGVIVSGLPSVCPLLSRCAKTAAIFATEAAPTWGASSNSTPRSTAIAAREVVGASAFERRNPIINIANTCQHGNNTLRCLEKVLVGLHQVTPVSVRNTVYFETHQYSISTPLSPPSLPIQNDEG